MFEISRKCSLDTRWIISSRLLHGNRQACIMPALPCSCHVRPSRNDLHFRTVWKQVCSTVSRSLDQYGNPRRDSEGERVTKGHCIGFRPCRGCSVHLIGSSLHRGGKTNSEHRTRTLAHTHVGAAQLPLDTLSGLGRLPGLIHPLFRVRLTISSSDSAWFSPLPQSSELCWTGQRYSRLLTALLRNPPHPIPTWH